MKPTRRKTNLEEPFPSCLFSTTEMWNIYYLHKESQYLHAAGGMNFPEQLFQLSVCLITSLILFEQKYRHTNQGPLSLHWCIGRACHSEYSYSIVYKQNSEQHLIKEVKQSTPIEIYVSFSTGKNSNCVKFKKIPR